MFSSNVAMLHTSAIYCAILLWGAWRRPRDHFILCIFCDHICSQVFCDEGRTHPEGVSFSVSHIKRTLRTERTERSLSVLFVLFILFQSCNVAHFCLLIGGRLAAPSRPFILCIFVTIYAVKVFVIKAAHTPKGCRSLCPT